MSSHKHHEQLQTIKEAIKTSNNLSDNEKTESIKQIEEWVLEDKAEGLFFEELIKISDNIKPLLSELGIK